MVSIPNSIRRCITAASWRCLRTTICAVRSFGRSWIFRPGSRAIRQSRAIRRKIISASSVWITAKNRQQQSFGMSGEMPRRCQDKSRSKILTPLSFKDVQMWVKSVATRLCLVRRVVALTGAGVSEESGIPTFRDPQTGLWTKYDPMVLATAEAFAQNPKLVWDWYEWRRVVRRGTQPNPGHYALAQMANLFPDFVMITQNIDGLHRL